MIFAVAAPHRRFNGEKITMVVINVFIWSLFDFQYLMTTGNE